MGKLIKKSPPARPNRKAGIRMENEQIIMDAAKEIFATYGYWGSSTSQIAERAGVPKANVYHYFGTKEHLYQRVLDRVHRYWSEAALASEAYSEPADALRIYIHRKMDMAREDLSGSKLWAMEVMRGAPALHGYLAKEVRDDTRRSVQRIEQWIKAGKIKPIDPLVLLQMIWACTQWYADFEPQIVALNGGKPLSDRQFAQAKANVTTTILHGIGAI